MFTECIFQSSKFDDWERLSKTKGMKLSFLRFRLLAPICFFGLVSDLDYWGWWAKMLKGTDLTEIPIEWMSAT
jgi:hypothetical protein